MICMFTRNPTNHPLEEMKYLLVLLVIFYFAQFGSNVEARKDPGEHFKPRPSISQYNDDNVPFKNQKFVTKDFESRPSITGYNNKDEKFFSKDFERRASITGYNKDIVPVKDGMFFTKDFEPTLSITGY